MMLQVPACLTSTGICCQTLFSSSPAAGSDQHSVSGQTVWHKCTSRQGVFEVAAEHKHAQHAEQTTHTLQAFHAACSRELSSSCSMEILGFHGAIEECMLVCQGRMIITPMPIPLLTA